MYEINYTKRREVTRLRIPRVVYLCLGIIII